VIAAIVVVIAGVVLGARAYERQQQATRQAINLVGTVATVDGGCWSLKEIRVRAGEPVRLRLTSADVTHGFYVPDLGVTSEPISPGAYVTVEFTPDRPGTYVYYCNVLCGHRHGAMIGRLVVEPAG
jgi:cytochrome c oxidase subunit 2